MKEYIEFVFGASGIICGFKNHDSVYSARLPQKGLFNFSSTVDAPLLVATVLQVNVNIIIIITSMPKESQVLCLWLNWCVTCGLDMFLFSCGFGIKQPPP